MFKEAYEEFKHVLLAFIYDKDDPTSLVAHEVGYYLFFQAGVFHDNFLVRYIMSVDVVSTYCYQDLIPIIGQNLWLLCTLIWKIKIFNETSDLLFSEKMFTVAGWMWIWIKFWGDS